MDIKPCIRCAVCPDEDRIHAQRALHLKQKRVLEDAPEPQCLPEVQTSIADDRSPRGNDRPRFGSFAAENRWRMIPPTGNSTGSNRPESYGERNRTAGLGTGEQEGYTYSKFHQRSTAHRASASIGRPVLGHPAIPCLPQQRPRNPLRPARLQQPKPMQIVSPALTSGAE